jgi:hypothetical protein
MYCNDGFVNVDDADDGDIDVAAAAVGRFGAVGGLDGGELVLLFDDIDCCSALVASSRSPAD